MNPLRHLSREKVDKIRYVLTDIDGTLTDSGRLTAETYASLWRLSRAGYHIVPVSGGGAGTAIYAIQAWPIDAIVTESGAIAYYRQDNEIKTFYHPEAGKNTRNSLRESMLREFRDRIPEFKLARDQFSRIFDIAVDYHEAKPYFNECDIAEVFAIAGKYGARVRQSSIHLNVYFGNYDKLDTIKRIFPLVFGIELDEWLHSCLYIGDAPNDQEMFRYFPVSAGVKNILKYADILEHKPKYIAESSCGEGFTEIADLLLNKVE
ncbi:MAG: HAD-IIB family hydrolase [Spirochaetales bacterium]|nr:HAD-IIB family hydrolase [Spirochaetales bacterium]